jgi:hypothetical protein
LVSSSGLFLVDGIRTGPAGKTRPTFAVYHSACLAPAIVLLQKASLDRRRLSLRRFPSNFVP